MAYDLDKYRTKRERVLGVRKRGLSFGVLAGLVAGVILAGGAAVAVPQTIEYLQTRNLDDAIFRHPGSGAWPEAVVDGVRGLPGVDRAEADNHDTRLVVTYDRRQLDPERIRAFLRTQGAEADLLNSMGHRHRTKILKAEAEFEAP